MKNFHTDVLSKLEASGDPKVVYKELRFLEPGTRAAVSGILADAKKMGVDLRVTETFRSQVRQAYLFKKKATKLRKVGCHGYGLAADFAIFRNGKYQTQAGPYLFLLPLCRKWGLISGLDWDDDPRTPNRFMDAGHVQRITTDRQAALFAGRWYPPETYSPRGTER